MIMTNFFKYEVKIMKIRNCLIQVIGLFLGIASLNVYAASSQLYFDNASGLGNAYAGEAAIAEDASTEYFNPAGLMLIHHRQVATGGVLGRFDGHFVGTDTFTIPGVASIQQTGFTNGRPSYGPYPFVYYAQPINNCLAFGFGILTPFGIGVSIPEYSRVRYAGTRFVMFVLDASPAIAYRLNDKVSLGIGLDFQTLSYYTRNMSPQFGGPDAKVINSANGMGIGFHAGVLYQMNKAIRAGLAFQSQTVFHPSGTSEYVFNPGANVGNEVVSNNFHFSTIVPATTTFSIYDEVTPCWAMLGSLGYSAWSSVRQTILYHIAQPGPSQVDGVNNQFYRDTWRLALGTNYKINPQWMLRAGTSFETDPTNDTYRPLTDPGSQAITIAFGARYQPIRCFWLDGGYLHSFIRSSSVNTVNGLNTEFGQVYLDRDALGFQATWDIL